MRYEDESWLDQCETISALLRQALDLGYPTRRYQVVDALAEQLGLDARRAFADGENEALNAMIVPLETFWRKCSSRSMSGRDTSPLKRPQNVTSTSCAQCA